MLQDFKSEIKLFLIVVFVSIILAIGVILLLRGLVPASVEQPFVEEVISDEEMVREHLDEHIDELVKAEPVLGAPRFFVDEVEFYGVDKFIATFEDGHVLGYLLGKYSIENGEVQVIYLDETFSNQGEENLIDLKQKYGFIELDTSDWQTFRHRVLGVEIEYPPDWVVEEKDCAYFFPTIEKNGKKTVVRQGHISLCTLSRNIQAFREGITYKVLRTIYVGGIPIDVKESFERSDYIREQYAAVIPREDYYIRFSFTENLDQKYNEIFAQMLATLLFTDEVVQNQTIRQCALKDRGYQPCWWELASSRAQTSEECQAIPDSSTRSSCYARLGEEKKSMDICEKSEAYAYTCKISVAVQNPTYSPEEAESIIADRAKEIVQALKNRNMEKLASFVHPEKPLRFWSINAGFELPKEKIPSFFTNQTEYTGSYDGSGLPFTFTQAEYYDTYVYDRDYLNAPEVSYKLSYYSSATTIGDQFERYHEEDPITATYAFPQGSPDAAFDWRNLRLWFTQENGIWYLREIMQNQWAI